jgi:hypothetical protein
MRAHDIYLTVAAVNVNCDDRLYWKGISREKRDERDEDMVARN